MFTVYEKSSDKAVKVYNVRHDKSGYPHFLVYEDGQWKYKSAKHYTPNYIPDDDEWCSGHWDFIAPHFMQNIKS